MCPAMLTVSRISTLCVREDVVPDIVMNKLVMVSVWVFFEVVFAQAFISVLVNNLKICKDEVVVTYLTTLDSRKAQPFCSCSFRES